MEPTYQKTPSLVEKKPCFLVSKNKNALTVILRQVKYMADSEIRAHHLWFSERGDGHTYELFKAITVLLYARE